ncbi:MAG: Hsp20/alpha crystallin family protein [Thermodesulfobacteriota bacterium]|nr:Hsp20/alpha crystallin family protein [Thermodesulfobacteriota bacterium]
MPIVKWEPFRDLLSLQDRMNRLFEESLGRTGKREELIQGSWAPPVDIYETAEAIVIQADLPGLNQEDIRVEMKDNTLVLSGERRFQKDVKQENYHRIERSYGVFNRSFALPASLEADKIKARFSNGILEIIVPKQEEAKPKQIKVNIE